MSIFVQYAPYHLKEGADAWPKRREAFGDTVVDTLAEYCPGLKESILHRQVLTPWDLEHEIGLTEGNIFQGELSLEQLLFLRPAPGWSRYRTPVRTPVAVRLGRAPGRRHHGLAGRAVREGAPELGGGVAWRCASTSIVIGAGHNGLATACMLAKAGTPRPGARAPRHVIGGMCAAGGIPPRLSHAPASCTTPRRFASGCVDALHLDEHGLELGPRGAGAVRRERRRGVVMLRPTRPPPRRRSRACRQRRRAALGRVPRLHRGCAPRDRAAPERDSARPRAPAGRPGAWRIARRAPAQRAGAAQRFGRDELAGLLRVPPDVRRRLAQRVLRERPAQGRARARRDFGHVGGPVVARDGGEPPAARMPPPASVRGGAAAVAIALERAARAAASMIRTDAEVRSIGSRRARPPASCSSNGERSPRRSRGVVRPASPSSGPHSARHAAAVHSSTAWA